MSLLIALPLSSDFRTSYQESKARRLFLLCDMQLLGEKSGIITMVEITLQPSPKTSPVKTKLALVAVSLTCEADWRKLLGVGMDLASITNTREVASTMA